MRTELPPYARAARAHLSKTDAVLARIIREVGQYRMVQRSERFHALARAIIFQQLAGPAAMAIYNRVVALFPGVKFPSPARILAASDEELRKAGLSRQKTLYIKDLAAHIENNSLNFNRFARMDDEEIIADLTQVKGIGRWTAEMFLMFNLGRPDVLPVGDLGFRNAVKKAYRMRKRPDAKRLRALGERWRPYRSAATWYLWQSLRLALPDGEARSARARRKRRTPAGPSTRRN